MGRSQSRVRKKHGKRFGPTKRRKPAKCVHCRNYYRKRRNVIFQNYCNRHACRLEAITRAKMKDATDRLAAHDDGLESYTMTLNGKKLTWRQQRQAQKAVNFGVMYGADPDVLRESIQKAIDADFVTEIKRVKINHEDK